MATLSLSMIVKDEERSLHRVLEAARHFCDEMVVVDTGSKDQTCVIAERLGARVLHFDWIDDFAAARNFALQQCTQDWIIWLDADDVVPPVTQAALRDIKQSVLNDTTINTVFTPYHTTFTPSGAVATVLRRERLVRRAAKAPWVGKIHEYIATGSSAFVDRPDIVIEHRPQAEDMARKKGRNLRNFEAWLNVDTCSLRDLFLYASDLLEAAMSERAIGVLEKYQQRVTKQYHAGERYMALLKLADALMVHSRWSEAMTWSLQAVEIDPGRAEAYCLMGINLTQQKKWAQAWPLFIAAASIPLPKVPPALGVLKFYTETPRTMIKRCLDNLDFNEQLGPLRDTLLGVLKPPVR